MKEEDDVMDLVSMRDKYEKVGKVEELCFSLVFDNYGSVNGEYIELYELACKKSRELFEEMNKIEKRLIKKK